MQALDLRGLVPAPITPFTRDGAVDYPAIKRLGAWLGSFPGVLQVPLVVVSTGIVRCLLPNVHRWGSSPKMIVFLCKKKKN